MALYNFKNSETWIKINEFPRYEVSNKGNVRNAQTLKHLRTFTQQAHNYLTVNLYNEEGKKNVLVHRLVAEAFIPNQTPEIRDQINHLDKNTHNNNASNLEWCHRSRNLCHAHHGDDVLKKIDLESGTVLEEFESFEDINLKYPDYNRLNIKNVLKGISKSAYGYYWQWGPKSIKPKQTRKKK